MKIDAIDLYLVKNEFIEPWTTAYGSDDGNTMLITRLRSGAFEGWSESTPLNDPTYCPYYAESVYRVAEKYLAPLVIGKEFGSARELNQMFAHIKGNEFAKAGIEMAWWTLKAAMEGKSLADTLGGTRKKVEHGADFGIGGSYDKLIENIGKAFDAGYTRVKLKAAHGWDVEMLSAVRSVFPNERLHIDCNSSYSFTEDDIAIMKKIDKFNLVMIEQPFRAGDLWSHAKLQKMLDTPLCLDESIDAPWQAEQAAELGACGFINIKPARCGGLQNSLDIRDICREAGIGNWVGGLNESDIGKSICVAVASLDNVVYPSDICPENENYREPIGLYPLKADADQCFDVPDRIGTPCPPDPDRMMKKIIRNTSFSAEA